MTLFILKIKISNLDFYVKERTRLVHFSKNSWRKAGRIPGEAPDFWLDCIRFLGISNVLQKGKIIVVHPYIISGKDFVYRNLMGNIHWFDGIGKLRHLEKQTGSAKGRENTPIIRIQQMHIIAGKDFVYGNLTGNIHWFDGIGKLRHLEKLTGSAKDQENTPIIKIQRMHIIAVTLVDITGQNLDLPLQ